MNAKKKDQAFDFNAIQSVEFGVCYDTSQGEKYWLIPVDGGVQEALKDILTHTIRALNPTEPMEAFEPAQKYSATERLVASIEELEMDKLAQMFEAENIETNAEAVKETQGMVFYFSIFRDDNGKKIIAVHRASQFKGIVKARNRLISLIDDTLKLVPDDVFKLDQDFDYVILEKEVWILHPTGFEFTAGIEDSIAKKLAKNITEVAKSVTCVDFSKFRDFIVDHKRASRLIAGLRARADIHLTSPKKLKRGCKTNGIQVVETEGKIYPKPGFEMAFLELLDRRRYQIVLIDGEEELYVAPNRRGVPKPTAQAES
jgi:Domain of unknown function (DUF4868)